MIVSGNGTEFTSMAMLRWGQDRQADWHHLAEAAKAATQAGLEHAPALLAITARFGHQNHTELHP